jgi:putative transposase
MARRIRPDWNGALHHVMARGICGESVLADESDRADIVGRLSVLVPGLSFRIFAWVLMPNHLHLLVQTGPVPLSALMHSLLTGFAVRYNLKHDRKGHVFQGRFKSILVQREGYFRKLIRYIHLNPLRAGIVNSVIELKAYKWSGHPSMLGLACCPWMDSSASLLEYEEEGSPSVLSYERALDADIDNNPDYSDLAHGNMIIGRNGLETIGSEEHARSWSDGYRVLGSREFGLEVLQKMRLSGGIPLRDRAEVNSGLQDLFRKVENRWGYSRDVIRGGSRSPELADIRSAIAWVASYRYGLTHSEIAVLLGCTRAAVTFQLSRSECLFEEIPFIREYLIQ